MEDKFRSIKLINCFFAAYFMNLDEHIFDGIETEIIDYDPSRFYNDRYFTERVWVDSEECKSLGDFFNYNTEQLHNFFEKYFTPKIKIIHGLVKNEITKSGCKKISFVKLPSCEPYPWHTLDSPYSPISCRSAFGVGFIGPSSLVIDLAYFLDGKGPEQF